MSKYDVPDDHWEPDEDDHPPQWRERTSATVDLEVTLHDEGYQTDRRWTVHVREAPTADHVIAGFAAEHQNKGNFWREPELWRDAVDFVELPLAVRKRTAMILNRPLGEITPDERTIHREDGTGVGDRASEKAGECEVCGGDVYGERPGNGSLRHEACLDGDVDV